MAASWTPAWAVRYDGSQFDEYRISESERGVTVRTPGATTGGKWWTHAAYANKFAATRREAIEKFRVMTARGVDFATQDLHEAEALHARALALAADEPPEPVQ